MLSFAYSMMSLVVLITSPMYLPATKPFWSEWIKLLRIGLILSAIQPLISLYKVSRRVKGRQLLRYRLSLSPLGIMLIIPRLLEADSLLLLNEYSTEFTTKCLISLQKNL